jgi:tRNA 2-thiouridine synthesizing protein A
MRVLDLTGLNCPHVVLRLAEQMRTLAPGDRLTVTATDPLSAIDVPFYLDKVGHRLVARHREDGRLVFVVECGQGAPAG